MFSSVEYNKSQVEFEQDRQWLAKEWERCNQEETAGEVGSDTLSCSDLGCIDDVREDEDPNRVSVPDNNNEHTETDYSTISIRDFVFVHGCKSELIVERTDDVYMNFPYDQKDSYKSSAQKHEKNREMLDFIDKAQNLNVENGEFKENELVEVESCLHEEPSDGSDVIYNVKKHEDCESMGIVVIDDQHTHEETWTCRKEITDEVNPLYGDDTPVNYCLDYGSDVDENEKEIINTSVIDEEQTKYDNSSGHNEDFVKSIKVIVIGEELTNYEEVKLLETEASICAPVSQYAEEPTDQSKPKQNDTQVQNINHQITQTCDILFRDNERAPSDMFICEYCQKVFATQYKLDSHRYRNHRLRKECEEKCFARPKSKHKASDDWPPNVQKLARRINGKKQFFCNYCSYSVDRCDSITKHMFRIHSNGRPVSQFQCEVCGKMFVDRAYLRNHKVSHRIEKLHSCDICGRAFHRQPSLKRHLQTHAIDRQYSCTLCDYQTNRKHMIYKHVENHKLGRAFICNICDLHLYTQLAYRSHMYDHCALVNSCSFCKVGFSSKERMMSHMRKTHSAYEINVYKKMPNQ